VITADLRLVDSEEEFTRLVEFVKDTPIIGLDTETTGLNPRDEGAQIRLMQFGSSETGWVLPVEKDSPYAEQGFRLMHSILSSPKYTPVFHNASFDLHWLRVDAWNRGYSSSYGELFPGTRVVDTMIMGRVLIPGESVALKPLSDKLLGEGSSGAQWQLQQVMKQNKWGWDTIPITLSGDAAIYVIYSALDPVLCCRMYFKLLELAEGSEFAEALKLELKVWELCDRMRQHGFKIDGEYIEDTKLRLQTWCDDAVQRFQSIGIENPNSAQQLLVWFNQHGVEIPLKITAAGMQSMDKEVLSSIDHDVARAVLQYRANMKIKTSYFENVEQFIYPDGRVRPSFNSCEARTYRFSVTEPALQTLPKRNAMVRRAYIPAPGSALVSCDYSQQELRIIAGLCRDNGLIDAFNSGKDFYCTLASSMFGREIGKHDQERQATKQYLFSSAYGAGAAKMGSITGLGEAYMTEVDQRYKKTYPQQAAWARQLEQSAKQRGYVILPTGHKVTVDSGKEYTAVNYTVQGTAAMQSKRAMLLADKAGVDLVCPVHDELIAEVPAAEAEEVTKIVADCMAQAANSFDLPIQFEADGKWSAKSWGDLVTQD